MLNLLDRMYIGMIIKMNQFMTEFHEDEKGISNFVATIVMILIVVLLCALFWQYISEWFESMWAKIIGQTNTIG